MDNKKAIDLLNMIRFENAECNLGTWYHGIDGDMKEALEMAIKALEQEPDAIHNEREQAYMKGYEDASKRYRTEPCEMTAEEYRQRMIQAFHNTDCDELIAVCVLPTEKEFEHLEWLLKNHYKKEPCEDAISRSDAIRIASGYCHWTNIPAELAKLPSVSVEKTGRWEWVQYDSNPNIGNWHCSECNRIVCGAITKANPVYTYKYCPECGAKMEVDE